MATTQFEATDARAAFPCFDEPEFKSKFIVTLVHEKGYKALSNMPVEKVVKRDDGFVESHFEESVKMSTYLLAFIVCDFAYKESHTKSGKKVCMRDCHVPFLFTLTNKSVAMGWNQEKLTDKMSPLVFSFSESCLSLRCSSHRLPGSSEAFL